VPLPEGVKLDDVKATFSNGVLEVSVPLPAKPDTTVRKVEIQESAKAAKPAA
jgi:HSP20 family molecular chaperone IbpA